MSFEKLKAVGFSDLEIKLYEYLIKKGSCKKEDLVRDLGMNEKDLSEHLSKMIALGSIEVVDDLVSPSPPRTFLQRYLKLKEVELDLQLAELRKVVNELQMVLEPIYSESKYGVRLEELWQTVDGLSSMEMETIRMMSRANSEISILAERFSYYPKVREELFSALDRKVRVRVLLLALDKESEGRAEDLKKNKIEVRLARCDWRSVRFTLVDRKEAIFLIWAKKSGENKVFYRPGYTKNPGMVSVFSDSFEYLWDKALPL
ncbi:MAG: TrmB family transcriptional regulator [Candidatus Methanomethylicaceae archaeon]